uniref:Cytochrome P450 n=1 Tax=Steinernema glaseri TaxID=37863 RepID=A0A1I7YL35_9BILA
MVALYVVAVVFLILIFCFNQKGKRLPPGPRPLPIIGNFPQFLIAKLQGISNVELTGQWKKKYGNVYTIWLGPIPVVLICDYKTTIDALVKNGDAHAGRQDTFAMRKIRGGNNGIIFADGPGWQEQKRFTLQTLRNFGLGKNLMQHIILEEVDYRFELLNKEISESVDQKVVIDPAPFMSLLIGSVINKLVVGYRYDESNMEEFLMMKRSFNAVLDIFTPFDFLIFSEKTYQLPVFKQRWAKAVAPNYEIRGILERQVNER